jgi:hypothetical protein
MWEKHRESSSEKLYKKKKQMTERGLEGKMKEMLAAIRVT